MGLIIPSSNHFENEKPPTLGRRLSVYKPNLLESARSSEGFASLPIAVAAINRAIRARLERKFLDRRAAVRAGQIHR